MYATDRPFAQTPLAALEITTETLLDAGLDDSATYTMLVHELNRRAAGREA